MQALLDEIYAHPDDDAPRLVYADWLLEHGDELGHGELIGLQLRRAQGPGTPEQQRREDELMGSAKHWLGPLKDLVRHGTLRFERGFVADCELMTGLVGGARPHEPAWSTVRQLGVHAYEGVEHQTTPEMTDSCVELVTRLAAGSLRAVGAIRRSTLASLASLPSPSRLETIICCSTLATDEGVVDQAVVQALAGGAPSLPRLRRLAICTSHQLDGETVLFGPPDFLPLLASPLVSQLDVFGLYGMGRLGDWLQALERGSRPSSLEIYFVVNGWSRPQYRFERDDRGRFSRLVVQEHGHTTCYVTNLLAEIGGRPLTHVRWISGVGVEASQKQARQALRDHSPGAVFEG